MKTDPNPATIDSPARRGFIKNLAVLGGAAALAPTTAMASTGGIRRCYPNWHARRFRFEAKGKGRFTDVVGFYWPFPVPAAELAWASVEVRMKFPYQQCDLLHLQVFLLPPASIAFFGSDTPVLISDSLTEIEEITVGPPVDYPDAPPGSPTFLSGPKPTFGMVGRVVANDVESPFGPMIGKIAMFGGAFDHEGDNVNFYLLGGMVAGQHATYQRPFQEAGSASFEHTTGSIHFHGYR